MRLQYEPITLTRNGEAEAVLRSVDDPEGLGMTLEILGDSDAVAGISESLAWLDRGEPGTDLATVRQDRRGCASISVSVAAVAMNDRSQEQQCVATQRRPDIAPTLG